MAALLLLAACGSDSSSDAPPQESSARPSTTAAPDATTTTISATPATSAIPTTPTTESAPPSSSIAPTTSAEPASVGWTEIDPAEIDAPLAFPCCASNWSGVPSPPLPPAGSPLADGVYRVSFDWPTDFVQPVAATVTRFDRCSVLPAGSCEEADSYFPDEVGIDSSTLYELPLLFDETLTVVFGGYSEGNSAFKTATGVELASLVGAIDAAYATAIAEPIAAGTAEADVVAYLRTSPAMGFGPLPPDNFAGQLVWQVDDSPAVLFQAINYAAEGAQPRGSDVIGRISLMVDDGKYSLQVYAGFYS